jgi:threonine dehydrogenase-like Zn-dependent dehydrogenase
VAAKFGADVVIDPTEHDVAEIVRQYNNGRGVDVAIEMSGALDAMQAAIRTAHFGGTVVAGAAPVCYAGGIDLGGDAHFNCLNLVFSRGCSEPNRDNPRWDTQRLYDVSWSLICARAVIGTPIVNQVVEFDTLAQTYQAIFDTESTIKLGVRMQPLAASS